MERNILADVDHPFIVKLNYGKFLFYLTLSGILFFLLIAPSSSPFSLYE